MDKVGIFVAIGVTAIFIGLALGSSIYESPVIPAKILPDVTKKDIEMSNEPTIIDAKLELDSTGQIGVITWPILGNDIKIYEEIEAKSFAGIVDKNPTFIVQKGIRYNIEIINNDDQPRTFIVPELGIESKEINPGEETTVTIYSQKEGSYNYYTKDQPFIPLGQIKIVTVDPQMKLEISQVNQKIKKFTEPVLEKTKEEVEKILEAEDLLKIGEELTKPKLTPRLVSIPEGTSIPGCEKYDSCYVPSKIIIFEGNTVVWKNEDSVTHTVTGGDIVNGPSQIFDSGLLREGDVYSFTFTKVGEYPYYCLIHPWMSGTVLVK